MKDVVALLFFEIVELCGGVTDGISIVHVRVGVIFILPLGRVLEAGDGIGHGSGVLHIMKVFEVGVVEGVFCGDALLGVVGEEFVDQVYGVFGDMGDE